MDDIEVINSLVRRMRTMFSLDDDAVDTMTLDQAGRSEHT